MPGAERSLGAGQDAGPDLRVAVERVHGRRDALGHRPVDRVARLRPVDGDDQHLTAGPRRSVRTGLASGSPAAEAVLTLAILPCRAAGRDWRREQVIWHACDVKRTIFDDEHDAFRQLCHDFLLQRGGAAHRRLGGGRDRRPADLEAGRRHRPARLRGAGGVRRRRDPRFPLQRDPRRGDRRHRQRRGRFHPAQRHQRCRTCSRCANDEQQARWLPGFVSGELITAIGMTEPSTGSDLQSIRTSAARRSGRRR